MTIRLVGGPEGSRTFDEALSTPTIRVVTAGGELWARYRHSGTVGDVHEYTFEATEPRLRRP